MLNSNFPMVGGLALQSASVRPQQLATGGLTYNAPTAGFDPYTYGQGKNGGWLFWKPPAPVVAPTPDPTAQPGGGLGGGPDAWQGGTGGTGSTQQTANGREWYSDRPTGYSALSPGAFSATMGGDHDGSVGGTSNASSLGGFLADSLSSMAAVANPGIAGMLGIGLGIANNRDNLSFMDAVKDAFGWGGGGGDAGWGGGENGDAGIGGDGVGNGGGQSTSDGSQGDTAATGGLITSHGVRRPYARGGLAPSGLIQGPGGGQDDRVPMTVPADSYVIPADVVAGLGDGNPTEGAARLHRAVGGRAPAMGGLSRPGVPVAVSPAEQVIPPDRVAALGGGNIDRGEKALDGFVRNVRKHKTSKGSKHPPKARPANSYMPRGKR